MGQLREAHADRTGLGQIEDKGLNIKRRSKGHGGKKQQEKWREGSPLVGCVSQMSNQTAMARAGEPGSQGARGGTAQVSGTNHLREFRRRRKEKEAVRY